MTDDGSVRRVGVLPPPASRHRPRMDDETLAAVRRWHECAYALATKAAEADQHVDYLGLDLVVPPGVAGITPVSHLLGDVVLAESRPGMRVLDVGAGCGSNALLAASRGASVVAVDVSAAAAAAARHNAERNALAHLIDVRVGDVFSATPERFDLVVLDPPLRWFRPRDAIEASITDEDYRCLTTFCAGVADHLTTTGRVLIFFSSAGDLAYLKELFVRHGLDTEVVGIGRLFRDGRAFDYLTYRAFPPVVG